MQNRLKQLPLNVQKRVYEIARHWTLYWTLVANARFSADTLFFKQNPQKRTHRIAYNALGKTRLWSKPPDIDKIAHALTQTADFTREHHRAFSARRDTELSGALSSMRWVSRHHSLPETNTPTRVPCQVQKRSEAQGCFIHQQLLVEHRYRWLAPCRQFR